MKREVSIQIGGEIRAYLENLGLQQQDVADRLGISQSAVSAYYRGKPFGKQAAQKWANEFGFNLTWLLTGEGPMLKTTTEPKNPVEVKPRSESSLVEYLQRKIKELEGKIDQLNDEKMDLLQENAVLKYENRLLTPDKRESAGSAADSLSADAI